MSILQVQKGRWYALSGIGAGLAYVGWLYASYIASHQVGALARPVVPLLPFLRIDSFGAICGIGSAVAFFGCAYLWPSGRTRAIRGLRAASLTGVIYGLSGSYYIAQNAVYHPVTLGWPLTHFLPYPHEQTFGMVSGLVAVVSLVALVGLWLKEGHTEE